MTSLAQQEGAMKDAMSACVPPAAAQQSSCHPQHRAAVTATYHLLSEESASWSVDGTNASASGFRMLSASFWIRPQTDHTKLSKTQHPFLSARSINQNAGCSYNILHSMKQKTHRNRCFKTCLKRG